MSDRLITGTPHLSPDSTRMFLQMLRQYYDQHVSRSIGYKDMDGLQYVGTAENFGSEMLIESRKMRMNRPPLDWVHLNSTFQTYFDLQYSDFINTYDQQNLIMACVRPNTMFDLGSNETYKVKFTNVQEVKILRAAADGDEVTTIDTFVKTFDPPTLMIGSTEYPLYVDDDTNAEHKVTYYFALNHMTEDLIDEYDNGTLITVDMKSYNEIPFIWFTLYDFRTDPPFTIEPSENVDQNSNPLLTIGTNGQHQNCIYPLIYGIDNVPSSSDPDGKWYLKVEGDFDDLQRIYGNKLYAVNMTARVTKVRYVQFATDDLFQTTPIVDHQVSFYGTHTKVTLNSIPDTEWIFHRPVIGDYDYDGTTYVNNVYALIPLDAFAGNIPAVEPRELMPALHLIFSDEYYHTSETMVNHMRTGLHLDYTTDYSDHSVEKKFGIVYGLSDFGGLPEYYNYFLDRTIHHSHIELYAIRDDANVRNQTAVDKQTAAIILESGIPDNDMKDITADMQPVIVYEGARAYISDMSHAVSSVNFLTDLGYYNNYTFSDVTIPQYAGCQRFVYHGNRTFSLGVIEFDPMLEYGRGYLITNDDTQYENNAYRTKKMAERTAARICDIPTSFDQLENISGVSPTIVIDTKYVSQKASYNENAFQKVWNELASKWYRIPNVYAPTINNLPSNIGTANGDVAVPPEKVNFISVDDFKTYLTIASPGSGYTTSSKFGFNIGGMFFRGTVTGVTNDLSNGVQTFTIDMDPTMPGDDPIQIPITNFDSSVSTFTPNTTVGTGSGLVLTCTIPSAVWNANEITVTTTHTGVYTYVYDRAHDGFYIIPYTDEDGWVTEQMTQLSGDIDLGNVYYDNEGTRAIRTTRSTYLFNMFRYMLMNGCGNLVRMPREDSYITSEKSIYNIPFDPDDITPEDLVAGIDKSQSISNKGLNTWDCYVAALPKLDQSEMEYKVTCWQKEYTPSTTWYRELMTSMLFPKRSYLEIDTYSGNWSGIKIDTTNTSRMIPTAYDVTHKTFDEYLNNTNGVALLGKLPITLSMLVENQSDPAYDKLYTSSRMSYNLYRFDPMQRSRQVEALRAELSAYDTNTLYNMIVDKFGDNNYVTRNLSYTEKEYIGGNEYEQGDLIVDSEQNLYAASTNFTATLLYADINDGNLVYVGKGKKEALINFYITNDYPVYDVTTLELFKQKGDWTDIPEDTNIGAFVPLRHLDETFVRLDRSGISRNAKQLYVFRIDDEISDLSHFRMYDGNVDISDQTLLIMNYKPYTFDSATRNWVLNYHANT